MMLRILLVGHAVEIDVVTARPLAVEGGPAVEVGLIDALILIAVALGLAAVL